MIAVTTNIKSTEYRRRENDRIGYPEHPRAGTSDDVEAFIFLLHRFLGNIFTVKDMKSLWICEVTWVLYYILYYISGYTVIADKKQYSISTLAERCNQLKNIMN